MPKLLIGFMLGLSMFSALAHAVPDWLIPSPLAIVIQVGKWIYNKEAKEPVYHVRVQSSGPTESDARNEAFRLAVDQAVGSLLLSESEIKNGNLTRHDLINYSSGYIHDFEYVHHYRDNTGVVIQVDVWVKKSQIAERLGVPGKDTNDLAGGKIAESFQSIDQQNRSGDAVVQAVLNDFPERAWNIQITAIEYLLENRKPILNVDFSVAWRPEFVNALMEAAQAVGQPDRPDYGGPGLVFDLEPCVFCRNKSFRTDTSRGSVLVKNTYWSFPRVLVTVYDKMKRPILEECVYYAGLEGVGLYHNLFATTTYQFKLYTKKVLENSLRMYLSGRDINNMDSVELAVVRKSHCPG
jgi:hypothetical protein